jgi:titin
VLQKSPLRRDKEIIKLELEETRRTSKADKTISAQEAADKGEALEEHIPHSTINITDTGDYRPGDKPVTQSVELELEETRRTVSTAQVIIQEK